MSPNDMVFPDMVFLVHLFGGIFVIVFPFLYNIVQKMQVRLGHLEHDAGRRLARAEEAIVNLREANNRERAVRQHEVMQKGVERIQEVLQEPKTSSPYREPQDKSMGLTVHMYHGVGTATVVDSTGKVIAEGVKVESRG